MFEHNRVDANRNMFGTLPMFEHTGEDSLWPAPSSIPACSATCSARRDARGVLRRGADRPLRRGRGGACPGRGALRRHPGGRGQGDRRPPPKAIAIDFDLLRHETEIVGYPILPLVHQLVEAVRRGRALRALGRDDPGHHGHRRRPADPRRPGDRRATTSPRCAASSPTWRERYRDTPMAGRTHLQQALPITFGYKAAVWLAMFDRHAERLEQLRPRVLVGAVRRRRRHAGLARRRGPRRAAGLLRGARARRAGRSPGTSPATASPRRSTCSAWSPARSARSRSTSC